MSGEAPKSTAKNKARPLPPELLEELSKILPRLATGDGEKAAVMNIVDNKLKAAGLDWHDFTGHVVAPAAPPPIEPAELRQAYNAGDADGYTKGYAAAKRELAGSSVRNVVDASKRNSIESEKLIRLITEMRAHCRFTEPSEAFLDSQLERADTYTNVLFSEKQKKWFLDLVHQAQRYGAKI